MWNYNFKANWLNNVCFQNKISTNTRELWILHVVKVLSTSSGIHAVYWSKRLDIDWGCSFMWSHLQTPFLGVHNFEFNFLCTQLWNKALCQVLFKVFSHWVTVVLKAYVVILQPITRLITSNLLLYSHKIIMQDCAQAACNTNAWWMQHDPVLVSVMSRKSTTQRHKCIISATVFKVVLSFTQCIRVFLYLVLRGSLRSSLYKECGKLPAMCSRTRKARGPLAATSITAPPPHWASVT